MSEKTRANQDADSQIGLPPRVFFYTVDQIGFMLELKPKYILDKLLYFEGRSPGLPRRDQMKAVNVASEGDYPEWRISESSFKSFLKFRGVKFYDRGFAR